MNGTIVARHGSAFLRTYPDGSGEMVDQALNPLGPRLSPWQTFIRDAYWTTDGLPSVTKAEGHDVSDEARDEAGRWAAEAGEDFSRDDAALRFDDIRRWTMATRDELKQMRASVGYRGSIGNRMLVNMLFADPTTVPTYRCAFIPVTREGLASEYPVGKQIDLPLTSFTRNPTEAGAYINGIMAYEHRDGLQDGTVQMVQFRLEPGAQAAEIGKTSITDAEVVTAGRFEVVSFSHDQTVTVAYGSGPEPRPTYEQDNVTVIGLRHIGIIKP